MVNSIIDSSKHWLKSLCDYSKHVFIFFIFQYVNSYYLRLSIFIDCTNKKSNFLFVYVSSGIIEVTNLSGLALKTPFGWSASEGWTDPEGSDLTFVFGFMEDGKENDLTQRISSTSINNALLPSGGCLFLFYLRT